MTNDEINRKIAEKCGWKISEDNSQYKKPNSHFWQGRGYDQISECIPNYCNDLNAMHEVEDAMTDEQCRGFFAALCEIIEHEPSSKPWIGYIHATARQRSEAFLRTVGEWEETK